MASLNKVEIIGRLGNDPEMRVMPHGESVATLSIAPVKIGSIKLVAKRKKKPNGIGLFSIVV